MKFNSVLFILFLGILLSCSEELIDDTTPPLISLEGLSLIIIPLGNVFEDPGVTAIDLVDGDLTLSILTDGEVDTLNIGSYTITYTVSDNSGNSTSIQRTVNVEPTTFSQKYNGKIWYADTAMENCIDSQCIEEDGVTVTYFTDEPLNSDENDISRGGYYFNNEEVFQFNADFWDSTDGTTTSDCKLTYVVLKEGSVNLDGDFGTIEYIENTLGPDKLKMKVNIGDEYLYLEFKVVNKELSVIISEGEEMDAEDSVNVFGILDEELTWDDYSTKCGATEVMID